MSALERKKAREIVCEAFNSFTDLKLQPTEEGEQAAIQKTLQSLSSKFVLAIYEEIKAGVKALGCNTSLGVSGFATARYKKVGSVVKDLIATTNCPK
jgi:hypothetical protein